MQLNKKGLPFAMRNEQPNAQTIEAINEVQQLKKAKDKKPMFLLLKP